MNPDTSERTVQLPDGQEITLSELIDRLLREGAAWHQENDLEQAERYYLGVLEIAPESATVHNYLGILRYQQHRFEEATEHLRRAVEIAPDYYDAWNNLGNILSESGRLEEGERAYARALELNAGHAGSWNNYGTVLRNLGKLKESIAAHERAIALAPDRTDFYFNFGNTVREAGDFEAALRIYRKALELHPVHSGANARTAYLLHLLGRTDEAVDLLRLWREKDPESAQAVHMLAAMTGVSVPNRASDAYVRDVFDSFASSFDAVLLNRLSYQAPRLVAEAVARRISPDDGVAILDAGCGTGLCGLEVRPLAGELTGIDLSRGMLGRARERGIYDHLEEAEITEYLARNPSLFDVIVSADTIVYFGLLDGFAQTAKTALRPGGWLVFTVERLDDAPGFSIGAHGRYLHSREYLVEVLSATGFQELSLDECILRTENGADVRGFVVACRSSVDRDGR